MTDNAVPNHLRNCRLVPKGVLVVTDDVHVFTHRLVDKRVGKEV